MGRYITFENVYIEIGDKWGTGLAPLGQFGPRLTQRGENVRRGKKTEGEGVRKNNAPCKGKKKGRPFGREGKRREEGEGRGGRKGSNKH